MSFNKFNLTPPLVEGLDTMGFNNPTPIQDQVIPHILRGADVIACAQTGTGKTAAYLLPVLHKISENNIPHTSALIISPTRLAKLSALTSPFMLRKSHTACFTES